MYKLLTTVFIAIAAVSSGWRVTFAADTANDHVQMDTLCYEKGTLVFQAVDTFPIAPGSTSFVTRRHITPATALCNISVYLFKNDDDIAAESASIVE